MYVCVTIGLVKERSMVSMLFRVLTSFLAKQVELIGGWKYLLMGLLLARLACKQTLMCFFTVIYFFLAA